MICAMDLLLLLIILPNLALSKLQTPMLILNSGGVINEDSESVPSFTHDLSDLGAYDSDMYVLFTVDKLNIEDFNFHRDDLSKVKKLYENSHHLFLPQGPVSSVIEQFDTKFEKIVADQKILSNLTMSHGMRKPLFQFNIDNKFITRQDYLRTTDDLIDLVIKQLETLKSTYTAIIMSQGLDTGLDTKPDRHSIRKRATDNPNMDNYYNFGCIKLYTASAPVLHFLSNSTKLSLNASLVSSNMSDCSNETGTQSASITWSNVRGGGYVLNNVTITYQFLQMGSAWKLQPSVSFDGTLDGRQISKVLQLNSDDVQIPKSFSYHCSSKRFAVKNITASADKSLIAVLFPGLQIEAFTSSESGQFMRAWDCTPFFTVPIWMGIFLSWMLVMVLTWAIYMLSAVPTMDKWDDSRGRPLQVSTSE